MSGPAPAHGPVALHGEPPSSVAAWRRSTVTGLVVVLACIASFQALVAHPSMLWFDVDPVLDPFPFAGIAPSTGLALDAIAAFLGALAAWLMRDRVDATGAAIMLLATVGAAVAWSHALGSADDGWRAAQWCGAMVGAAGAGVSVRALGPEDRAARIIAVAVLASAAVPMALRGAIQWWIEHPATVEAYRANMGEVLAARGWAPGSPQALTYERRLMQPEITAWFGMSNVASSVMGAACLIMGGAACAAWGRSPRIALSLGAAAAACAASVAANGSKGAIAALALALGFVAWVRWRSPRSAWRSTLALLLVALPVVAVFVRGWFGAGWGERSLLFRSHYAEAALRMVGARPGLGVGPAGFGDAYLQFRPWQSPEEVQSAHAAWADWVACLGVGGWCWVGLLAVWVALVARGAAADAARSDPAEPWTAVPRDGTGVNTVRLVPAVAALCAATVVMVASVTDPALDTPALVLRMLAASVAAAAAGSMAWAAGAGGSAVRVALAGAALMLVIHAQVEMTLWWPGAISWVAMVIALAASAPRVVPARDAPHDRSRDRSEVAPYLVAAVSLALMTLAAHQLAVDLPGARAAERRIADAAAPLAALGRARLEGTAPSASEVAEARLAAGRALEAAATDPMRTATDAWLLRPARPAVRAAALVQLASASEAPGWREAALESLAVLPVQDAVASAGGLLAEQLARSGADEDLQVLVKWAQLHCALNVRTVRGYARLAEALARRGDAAGAATAARAALRINESYALDPLRMLPDAERRRLEALTGDAGTSRP